VIDEFELALERLSDAPELGRPRPDLSEAPDLRSWPVRSWLVFFRNDARGLEVVRILHGSRDLGRHLGPR